MTWGPLLLLLGGLCLQQARAGSHSLRYFYSSLSGPLPGVPQFSSVGYVDDIPISGYTSESHRVEPLAPWMERISAEDAHYWEDSTEISRGAEQVYKVNVRIAMERLNQTEGLHMFQRMYGCELRDDGSIGGFDQFAFDGHDFLSFDKDRLTFTAAMDAARITQDRWDSEMIIAQRDKEYLEGECIEYLKKYLKLGEERLRRVAPQAAVTRRKTSDHTFLTGYAYGFYPRDIEVKWVRNGVEIPWESRDILPNPDGTYQVRTTVEVQEGDDEKTYRYEVYHSSLPDTVTVMYEEKSPPMGVIIGGVIGALVGVGMLAAVIWVVYSKKKKSGKSAYTAANRDPAPGDSSSSQCSA
ncbi:RLA class I histocompatibility antigen, alpha chain 11/11-like [Pleurodeles waltl]|uniref:RLA class I histocompatibility antigen, alpha chain 11/11-like n=1 Tax=Pleurodeles waltl TaxID=8319 RepID=UPI003709995E